MANTFELIASSTVGSGGAGSITFSSIPSTYTDICVLLSGRQTGFPEITSAVYLTLNGSTSSFTNIYLQGSGSAASSGSIARFLGGTPGDSATSNTFGNTSIYIPNYAGSTNKSFSVEYAPENNATTTYAGFIAGLWANTAAITSLTLVGGQTFVQNTNAYLYGVKNA